VRSTRRSCPLAIAGCGGRSMSSQRSVLRRRCSATSAAGSLSIAIRLVTRLRQDLKVHEQWNLRPEGQFAVSDILLTVEVQDDGFLPKEESRASPAELDSAS